MFGLCGIHIWVLVFFVSAFVILGTEKIDPLTHKIFSQLIKGATSVVAVIIPRLDSSQAIPREWEESPPIYWRRQIQRLLD